MSIKELRHITKLSQTEFAKKYDIPLATIKAWECGRRPVPEYVAYLLQRIVTEIDYKGADAD